MTDGEQKRPVGRPKGTGKRKPGGHVIKLYLSATQFNYLTWLSNNTKLGRDEEIVALHLLTERMEELSPSDKRQPK